MARDTMETETFALTLEPDQWDAILFMLSYGRVVAKSVFGDSADADFVRQAALSLRDQLVAARVQQVQS